MDFWSSLGNAGGGGGSGAGATVASSADSHLTFGNVSSGTPWGAATIIAGIAAAVVGLGILVLIFRK
jgi:hypothetical protein